MWRPTSQIAGSYKSKGCYVTTSEHLEWHHVPIVMSQLCKLDVGTDELSRSPTWDNYDNEKLTWIVWIRKLQWYLISVGYSCWTVVLFFKFSKPFIYFYWSLWFYLQQQYTVLFSGIRYILHQPIWYMFSLNLFLLIHFNFTLLSFINLIFIPLNLIRRLFHSKKFFLPRLSLFSAKSWQNPASIDGEKQN